MENPKKQNALFLTTTATLEPFLNVSPHLEQEKLYVRLSTGWARAETAWQAEEVPGSC